MKNEIAIKQMSVFFDISCASYNDSDFGGKHRGDVMECSMDMMVAVVDPLLQNENWSVKERVGGGWRSAGCKK